MKVHTILEWSADMHIDDVDTSLYEKDFGRFYENPLKNYHGSVNTEWTVVCAMLGLNKGVLVNEIDKCVSKFDELDSVPFGTMLDYHNYNVKRCMRSEKVFAHLVAALLHYGTSERNLIPKLYWNKCTSYFEMTDDALGRCVFETWTPNQSN